MNDGPRTTRPVTARDAWQYDGTPASAATIAAHAGKYLELTPDGPVITAANGTRHPLPPGYWVIDYGPGDYGVMSPGARERHFGDGSPDPVVFGAQPRVKTVPEVLG